VVFDPRSTTLTEAEVSIRYCTGNLLDDDADALVNTVNCAGVMGKGLALAFKQRHPSMFDKYADDCRLGLVKPGKMHVVALPERRAHDPERIPRVVVNFPTKLHWSGPSRYEWIEHGLVDLARIIRGSSIKSIAVPPLGCGLGGLDWTRVEPMIVTTVGSIERLDLRIYPPTK
jgi:O-acetyl-ADP-ribose deacetylase (regulator of RNase III)